MCSSAGCRSSGGVGSAFTGSGATGGLIRLDQSAWSVVAPRLELETNLAYLPRIPWR
ncbi:MAG: transglycosylase family protein [Synechococcus sp. BS301-5m-G53]|nr:transglycosylase family protein [Synechococcus sp. BS301-5m-G53]